MATWLLILVIVNPVDGTSYTQTVDGYPSATVCQGAGQRWEDRRKVDQPKAHAIYKCVRS